MITGRLTSKLKCPKCNSDQSWWLGLLGMVSKEDFWGRYKWQCSSCGTSQAFPLTTAGCFWASAVFSGALFGYSYSHSQLVSRLTNAVPIPAFLLLIPLWFLSSLLSTILICGSQIDVIATASIVTKKKWTDDIFISDRPLALKCGFLKAVALMSFTMYLFLLSVAALVYFLMSAFGFGMQ